MRWRRTKISLLKNKQGEHHGQGNGLLAGRERQKVTLVYEFDHWDMSPEGVRYRRDEFSRQGF